MADAPRSRGPLLPLTGDYSNDNPYRGLPHGYPSAHSRFPIIPPPPLDDFSFDPSLVQNGGTEGDQFVQTEEEQKAWQEALKRMLGDLYVDDGQDG